MNKKIKKRIRAARRRLSWPVTEQHGDCDTLMITSDYQRKTHTIHVPASDVRPLEWLHEYGHAILCETVHPMFSTQYFRPGTPQDLLDHVSPACQAASDWFVDQWLFKLMPQESVVEIKDHLGMVMRHLRDNPAGSPDIFCGACLMIAQGDRYCGIKTDTGGVLSDGVNALLTINPARPSIQALQDAVNGLLQCFSEYRVVLSPDEYGVWRLLGCDKR